MVLREMSRQLFTQRMELKIYAKTSGGHTQIWTSCGISPSRQGDMVIVGLDPQMSSVRLLPEVVDRWTLDTAWLYVED